MLGRKARKPSRTNGVISKDIGARLQGLLLANFRIIPTSKISLQILNKGKSVNLCDLKKKREGKKNGI